MSLVVDFRLSGDPIDLPTVAAALPDATFEIEQWEQDGDLIVWYVWARGEDLDRATEEFRDLSQVESVSLLTDTESVRLYRVAVVPNIDIPPMDLLSEGMLTEGYIEPHCLRFSGRVSGREALTGTWRYLRSSGIEVTVDGLRRATDDEIGRLTDPQFEALVTAYEMGYFDSPKRATHAEVADELGIARSSLSERLRRAEHELVRRQIEG